MTVAALADGGPGLPHPDPRPKEKKKLPEPCAKQAFTGVGEADSGDALSLRERIGARGSQHRTYQDGHNISCFAVVPTEFLMCL